MEGRLTLPRRGLSTSAIDEAIACERGEVVYEILSRSDSPNETTLTYRALPKKVWQKLGTLPRHRWPLIPQEEKARRLAFWSSRAEILLLGVLSLTLLLAAWWQGFEIFRLQRYVQRLQAFHQGTSSASAPARPQDTWVRSLNQITAALSAAHVKIKAFDFTPARAQLTVEPRPGSDELIRSALHRITGRDPLQIKGGVWQW